MTQALLIMAALLVVFVLFAGSALIVGFLFEKIKDKMIKTWKNF